MDTRTGHSHDKHDWRQADYAAGWVAKNEGRVERRAAVLDRMMALAPYSANQALRVLDVGGGYGFVSAAVLRAFPLAQVTLQDFSAPMIEEAKRYLGEHSSQMNYALSDLTDPDWAKGLGPFDLVVSAIAIHNLRNIEKMRYCYAAIRRLLALGGCFLDCDHLDKAGGASQHVQMMKDVGFDSVEIFPGDDEDTPIIKARRVEP